MLQAFSKSDFLCVLHFGIWSTWTFDWLPTYLTWTVVDIWLTTYLPHLVHVVCERPLIPKFATGLKCLNRYRSKSIWVIILSLCQNDSLMGYHFGKRTEWSLIYFLIYANLNILAQSQILVISLYMPLVFRLTIITQSIGGETVGGQYPKSTFYFDFAKRAFSPGPKLLVCSLYNSDMYFDINF